MSLQLENRHSLQSVALLDSPIIKERESCSFLRHSNIKIIHDSVPGRTRLEIPGLKENRPLKHFLELELRKNTSVHSVSASIITGNILVYYSLNRDTLWIRDQIEELLQTSDKEVGQVLPFPIPDFIRNDATLQTSSTQQGSPPWHQSSAESILSEFESDPEKGISSRIAEIRLNEVGPNELERPQVRSEWDIFLSQFKSPPVVLLVAASGVALVTGGIVEAAAIFSVVAANAVIGYRTESMAEKTLSLLENEDSHQIQVYRDGIPQIISIEFLVPGDLMVLTPGISIPADGRLIQVNQFTVDESVLTGESLPIHKTIHAMEVLDLPLGDRQNMVFRGTLATGGTALAVVVATGLQTEIGKIQRLVNETRHSLTPFQTQIAQMSRQLIFIGGTIGLALLCIGLTRGYGTFEMLKLSLALAIAAIPEGLPAIATLAFTQSVLKMRRRNVFVRNLDAIETLGAIEVLCLDKTGTLTLNQMEVVSVFTGMKEFKISQNKIVRETIESEFINYGLNDKFDKFNDKLSNREFLKLIEVCALCNETEIIQDDKNQPFLKGSSTEKALMELALGSDLDINQLRIQKPILNIEYRSETRAFMKTTHRTPKGSYFIAVKGSPSQVLALCHWQLKDGKKQPLSIKARRNIEAQNQKMASQALRVLGLAYFETRDEDFANALDSSDKSLIWLGLVGMEDIQRPGTSHVIRILHRAGIKTVMITGDQSTTAQALGKSIGLSGKDWLKTLDSNEIRSIPTEELNRISEGAHIFSRVSPSDKLRIVRAIQANDKVVAMMGDGVNDAPALKASDVGITLGKGSTQAAKGTAGIVITDDQLNSILPAIELGRGTHDSIKKSIFFLLSTNFSECLLMLGACLLGLGQPLSPLQILWINLISDLFPALALALEPPESDVMTRPPRNPSQPLIGRPEVKRIGIESTIMMGCSLVAYRYGVTRYGYGRRAQTMAFLTLTSAQLFHTFSSRSIRQGIFGNEKLPSNPYVPAAVGAGLALQALPLTVPGVSKVLGVAPLGGVDFAICAGGAFLSFLLNESYRSLGIHQKKEFEQNNRNLLEVDGPLHVLNDSTKEFPI